MPHLLTLLVAVITSDGLGLIIFYAANVQLTEVLAVASTCGILLVLVSLGCAGVMFADGSYWSGAKTDLSATLAVVGTFSAVAAGGYAAIMLWTMILMENEP